MTEYTLRRGHNERQSPGGHPVHHMEYWVAGTEITGEFLSVPCRARLHHLITGLFYNWDWKDEKIKMITEKEAFMLKHIFTSQTEYGIWKKGLEKIKEVGEEETKKWLMEQVKVLALRNVMKEGSDRNSQGILGQG